MVFILKNHLYLHNTLTCLLIFFSTNRLCLLTNITFLDLFIEIAVFRSFSMQSLAVNTNCYFQICNFCPEIFIPNFSIFFLQFYCFSSLLNIFREILVGTPVIRLFNSDADSSQLQRALLIPYISRSWLRWIEPTTQMCLVVPGGLMRHTESCKLLSFVNGETFQKK